jgi:Flp pilus assembly protein TadD
MPDFHPDPQIQALIESCGAHLRGELVKRGSAAAALSPTRDARPSASQLEAVYATTCQLCDEGNFAFAAGLALHLVAYEVTDTRFTFIAGTCMQRLGLHANAAQLFGFSLVHGGDHPATLFRFGECLLALGDRENAAQALEAAFDLSRGDENARGVQAMCEQLMASLNQGARAASATAASPEF